jgi:hypothetical protein
MAGSGAAAVPGPDLAGAVGTIALDVDDRKPAMVSSPSPPSPGPSAPRSRRPGS